PQRGAAAPSAGALPGKPVDGAGVRQEEHPLRGPTQRDQVVASESPGGQSRRRPPDKKPLQRSREAPAGRGDEGTGGRGDSGRRVSPSPRRPVPPSRRPAVPPSRRPPAVALRIDHVRGARAAAP